MASILELRARPFRLRGRSLLEERLRGLITAPGSGGGGGPDEPGGYTQIFSQPFDALPPNLNSRDQYNWGFDRDRAQCSIIADATALKSPSNVIDGLFDPAWFTANTGGAGGSAPFRLEGGFF